VDGGPVTDTAGLPGDTGAPATTTSGTTPATPCAAAGFAAATEGLEGAALWDALTVVTAPQTCASYSAATEHLFLVLDNVDDSVECVYTGRVVPVTDSKPDATVMNTEHTWPQSQGADEVPARCDLHHLYPTDSNANSTRAAYAFGQVSGTVAWSEGGSSLGEDALGTTVFEPRDVHKGNVARSMLYFSARYAMPLPDDQVALFKAWHAQDPVDEAERSRTWGIASFQELANPLVVCPDRVERL